ncbi:MAG TPA: hypothetical protein VFG20_05935 [Planctomycetaceae bacterium]|jgi:hypothetical protein|nr:hypothetical protein [Planctomycetaceae bacterium]
MNLFRRWLLFVLCASLTTAGSVIAQEAVEPQPVATESPLDRAKDNAEDAANAATKKVEELAREVDRSPQAKEISAGILQPIYQFAERLSFPFFHWVAFAVMATGVVSYALQLVLGKLVVLTKMGFSPAEILSDAHGLVISLVGLVLTTQAAAENSTFTQSPFAVISAAAVGVIVGFVFYLWGQAQEVQAAKARALMTTRP